MDDVIRMAFERFWVKVENSKCDQKCHRCLWITCGRDCAKALLMLILGMDSDLNYFIYHHAFCRFGVVKVCVCLNVD